MMQASFTYQPEVPVGAIFKYPIFSKLQISSSTPSTLFLDTLTTG
jgi:hypothetical protein